MDPMWGSAVFLIGPIVVLLALRRRRPVRPLLAYGSAIAAEYVSLGLFALWLLALTRQPFEAGKTSYEVVVIGTGPSFGRALVGLGFFAALGSAIASAFLIGQWLVGRLTCAWSRCGV